MESDLVRRNRSLETCLRFDRVIGAVRDDVEVVIEQIGYRCEVLCHRRIICCAGGRSRRGTVCAAGAFRGKFRFGGRYRCWPRTVSEDGTVNSFYRIVMETLKSHYPGTDHRCVCGQQ
jgi:hypothetical protein